MWSFIGSNKNILLIIDDIVIWPTPRPALILVIFNPILTHTGPRPCLFGRKFINNISFNHLIISQDIVVPYISPIHD